MWKNYSADYIKHNRASGISIIAAALIAALFLSFLCCLFYHFWLDGIEGVKAQEGGWHGRITGEIDEDALAVVRGSHNVEKAVVNETLSGEGKTAVDIWFYNKRTAYQDMTALVRTLGLTGDAADYNYQLLSLYFIRIPGDEKPRLLMPAYLAIVGIVCISLILVIHNSFAVSMNSRIHQFGILASIGATPKQIRAALLQEAFVLSAAPICAGAAIGTALCFLVVRLMNAFAGKTAGGRQTPFRLHSAVFAAVVILSFVTVLLSAWIPAVRLSRLTPLAAIRGAQELQIKKGRSGRVKKTGSPVLYALFGMEGELAGNAFQAQKKAMRTASLSLTLAFFGFMVSGCFWTLSNISTNHTYFAAFQDAWDVMAVVKDTGIEEFDIVDQLRDAPGAESIVVYQKAEADCLLPRKAQSEELLALGGLDAFLEEGVTSEGETVQIKAPVVILDDKSFEEFCAQNGIGFRADGAIVLNRFWDSANSNFRYPAYIPYVKENLETVTLQGDFDSVEIPVLAYTKNPPLLREEYEKADYPLVQFIPASLWRGIKDRIGGMKPDLYIRALAIERTSQDALKALENEMMQVIGGAYETVCENRIQEKTQNDEMIKGYQMLIGAFCVLLALIGISHMFSHTLGFLSQRKREFARYMSVGLTPDGVWHICLIEALAAAGRPLFISWMLTAAAVTFMIRASFLDPMEFIREAPVMPVLAFALAVYGFVASAYYLGAKKLTCVSLADVLRDDTMM